MQYTAERRQAILELVCERRHENIANLMFEFGVSRMTIIRDLQVLSISYPIYTIQGNGGGVYIVEGFRLGRKYLSNKQAELLEKIAKGLMGDDLATMQSILKMFKEPGRGKS